MRCALITPNDFSHEFNNSEVDEEEEAQLRRIRRRVAAAIKDQVDHSRIGFFQSHYLSTSSAVIDGAELVEVHSEHESLKDKLINHLNVQYYNGKLRWYRI